MTEVHISKPNIVRLFYHIPEHLKGCPDLDAMRKKDLLKLNKELKSRGSSVQKKTSEKVIWRRGFPGMVLNVEGASYLSSENAVHLDVAPIHPFRADLAFGFGREGKVDDTLKENAKPLTTNAILEDLSGDVILGIRCGEQDDGSIGVYPGGHADYVLGAERMDSFLDSDYAMISESCEESGIMIGERGKIPIIAFHHNADTQGFNVLYHVKSGLNFRAIKRKWERATHKHEHRGIVCLSRGKVEQLASEGKAMIESTERVTSPFFQNCLKNYLEYSSDRN